MLDLSWQKIKQAGQLDEVQNVKEYYNAHETEGRPPSRQTLELKTKQKSITACNNRLRQTDSGTFDEIHLFPVHFSLAPISVYTPNIHFVLETN